MDLDPLCCLSIENKMIFLTPLNTIMSLLIFRRMYSCKLAEEKIPDAGLDMLEIFDISFEK
jgi:hypothetical protein